MGTPPGLFKHWPSLMAACLLLSGAARGAEAYTVRGLTEPVGDVVLSVPTAGIIAAVRHGEGTFVEAGAVIIELSSRAEELEVARREVQLNTVTSELARSELLFKTSNSVPREELDRKRAEVDVAKVELAQAEEILARRRVVAPIAGVVTLVSIKVGEYCDLGQPIARVVDTREFDVVSNVDPQRAGHLRAGQPVTVELPSGGERTRVTGEVVFVAPVIDPASGLLRIRARFANPDGAVRPGVAGTLEIPARDAAGN